MAKGQRITIKDIARLAKVTPQTVSRALRDAPDIAEATRNKVLKIAREQGYVKNNTASALRRGSSKVIAVVFDNLMNIYFSIMSDYLQLYLNELGYSMLTLFMRRRWLDEEVYLSAISHNVDGIISFLEPNEEITALIHRHKVPVLLFGRRTELAGVDCIYTNDNKGGRLAAKRLMSTGCKRTLLVTESLDLTCAFDRYDGFTRQLSEDGGNLPAVIIPDSDNPIENHLKKLMEKPEKFPDGIFCFNDMLAFKTIDSLRNSGMPACKVVGYDDVQHDIALPGRLTTVGTDKCEMARTAARIITERGDGEEIRMCMDVFLVEGETA